MWIYFAIGGINQGIVNARVGKASLWILRQEKKKYDANVEKLKEQSTESGELEGQCNDIFPLDD